MKHMIATVLVLLANVASAQQFEEVSKSVGLEMITSFAENREKFSSFACKGAVTVELVTSSDEVIPTYTQFVVLENHAKRSARSMYRIQDLSEGFQASGWQEIFTIKGKRILGGEAYGVK